MSSTGIDQLLLLSTSPPVMHQTLLHRPVQHQTETAAAPGKVIITMCCFMIVDGLNRQVHSRQQACWGWCHAYAQQLSTPHC